jgi:hypothetical protein
MIIKQAQIRESDLQVNEGGENTTPPKQAWTPPSSGWNPLFAQPQKNNPDQIISKKKKIRV